MKTISFGIHFLLDIYGADKNSLNDETMLKHLLITLPAELGMHTICDPVVLKVGAQNRKDPGGVSGFVMIAESHISFHTFPNRGFATIDVYTCHDELDTEKLEKIFKNFFKYSDCETKIMKRGVRYPAEDIL